MVVEFTDRYGVCGTTVPTSVMAISGRALSGTPAKEPGAGGARCGDEQCGAFVPGDVVRCTGLGGQDCHRGERMVGELRDFRSHDLRHCLASLLIGSGLGVKVVPHRPRHGSAKTTVDTYGHMRPDSDESARAADGAMLAARAEDSLRTGRAAVT